MRRASDRPVRCQICGELKRSREVFPAAFVHPPIVGAIVREHPDWSEDGHICLTDLNHYRTQHVREAMEAEQGEFTELEKNVIASIHAQELTSQNLNREYDEHLTFGDRLADRVAEFGGSWRFIISFTVFMTCWIGMNTAVLFWRPWDPYPFILLNLLLSGLAALQAPIIMMSQNRQEAKDRLRAERDYQINLKAELEIRNLHAKIDLLLSHQWQHLLEIQEIQTEMMEELSHRTALS